LSQILFHDFQPLAAIATTPTGAKKLQYLSQVSGATLWVPETLAIFAGAQGYAGSLKSHLATLWPDYKGFVFSLATGAVVRLIAPLLTHKSQDPAVVVVDEGGQFVISICSGHQGGADRLTQLLAHQLEATPVITGAADAAALPAIDTLGIPFGWQRGQGNWNGVSAAIARRQPVQVIQEAGSTLWQQQVQGHPFYVRSGERKAVKPIPFQAKICISPDEQLPCGAAPEPQGTLTHEPSDAVAPLATDMPMVQWHPRVLWIGVGCERGSSRELIESGIRQVLQSHQLAWGAIAGVATIDLKADEQGLIKLCQAYNWPLRCFPAAVLQSITVPNPSEIVAAEVGTPSVAEAAALRAIGEFNLGIDEVPKMQNPLRIAKQVIRAEGQKGAVTIAVAQAEQEWTGRTGHLWLIGTGPGQLDQMTPAAKAAVCQADAVIGYGLYIDLLQPLLRPSQVVERFAITQERQRAERAIALAYWGLTVAVVSSGDCGIYGMAGLVLEQLQAQGWDGKTPGVEIFPGITALQATASRVGTPLMHDFCAISLSTLLTPWAVIERRLEAAAQANFVTALYNPRSQTRVEQLVKAQEIFLQYRQADTPVAIVRSAYRPDEQTILMTLDQLQDATVDMLTTVLIGNHSTRTYAGWMITPRGYFQSDDGEEPGALSQSLTT